MSGESVLKWDSVGGRQPVRVSVTRCLAAWGVPGFPAERVGFSSRQKNEIESCQNAKSEDYDKGFGKLPAKQNA